MKFFNFIYKHREPFPPEKGSFLRAPKYAREAADSWFSV